MLPSTFRLAFVLTLLASQISFAQHPASELRPGKPVERRLAGGAIQSHKMNLIEGQYVGLLVEQKGIDVTVALFGPDGALIGEFGRQSGYPDREDLAFLPTASGTYRLEVRPAHQDAAEGIYLVAIEQQREATARDRRLVAAKLSFHQAERMRESGDMESIRKSIAIYHEAVTGFAAAGECTLQAQTLLALASAQADLIERQPSLESYEKALSISRQCGDRQAEALALAGVGITRLGLSREKTWLAPLHQARQIITEVGDRRGLAAVLSHLAAAHYALNEYQKCLDLRNQTLTAYRDLHDRRAEFNTLLSLGMTNNSIGERVRAIEYYQLALAVSKGFLNQAMEAELVGKIGQVYYGMVEYPTALKYYQRALTLIRATNDRYGECLLLKYIGSTYLAIGQHREALDYLTLALQIARDEGKRELELGTLRNLAMSYAQLGEPEKSRDYFKRELQIAQETGARSVTALTLYVKAEFERDQGNYDAAIEDILRAIELMESFCANVVARDLRATYYTRIRGLYEIYVDILMLMHRRDPSKNHDHLALHLSERSRVRSLLEILNEAQANLRQGISPELLKEERAIQQQLSAKAEDVTQWQPDPMRAEQVGVARREIADLTRQYQELQSRIRTSSPRYAALTQPSALTVRELQEKILDENTVLLEYMLGRKRSYVWAVTRHSVASSELTGKVAIRLAAQNFYDLLTARNKQIPFETRDEKAQRVTKAEATLVKASATMSRMLLAPVAKRLNKKRILIVADPTLEYIPFAYLPKPAGDEAGVAAKQNPLVADHEIVNLPSASTLAVLRQEVKDRKPSPKTLAIFGDPVFSPNDARVDSAVLAGRQRAAAISARKPSGRKESELNALSRLPYTRKEAEVIAALVPASQKKAVLDFEANHAAATDPGLSRYRYIHFATHAIIDQARPELSGIALSTINRQGVEQKGFLRMYEIYNLRLPADLVVLSGCRTGLGRELRGEGLIGLTRGFMYAGAARVLVSLWDVSDEATADFMARFYQALLGKEKLTPAAALQTAQASMASDPRWSSPYYWAAFVLQGEPK